MSEGIFHDMMENEGNKQNDGEDNEEGNDKDVVKRLSTRLDEAM